MEKTQQKSSNQTNGANQKKRRRKGPRADFGRPVYWKPNFNGPKDKDGFILMTQQKTYAGLCKKEAKRFSKKSKNNKNVVGTNEYTQNKKDEKIKEIGDLVTK